MRVRHAILPTVLLLALAACEEPAPPTVPPLGHERHGHVLARVGDRLVCAGGFARGATTPGAKGAKAATWLLDLPPGGSSSWRLGPFLGTGKAFCAAAVVGGRMVVIGTGGIERLAPDAASWERLDDGAAFPDTHLGGAALGDVLYTVGGFPAERGRPVGYDVAARRVVDVPPLPGFVPGDHLHVVAALDGGLHVIGGLTEAAGGLSDQHWRLQDGRWRERASPPKPLWAKFAAVGVLAGRLHVFGDTASLRYDPAEDAWAPVAPLPDGPLAMPGSVVLEGRLVVVGGRALEGPSDAVRIYDPATDAWTVHVTTVEASDGE